MLEAELSRRAKRLEKENSSRARRIRRSKRKQERQRKEREKEVAIEREKRRVEREQKEREEGRVSRLMERVNEAYDRIAPKVTGLRRVSTEFSQEMRELDRVADLRAKLLSKRFALVRAIDRIRSWTCVYVVFSNVGENFIHISHFNTHFIVGSIGLTLNVTLNITIRIRKLRHQRSNTDTAHV